MRISIIVIIMLAMLSGVSGFCASADNAIKLRNTHYYVVLESEYSKYPVDNVIRTMKGEILARVSQKFRRAVDIEGTGRLIDGRVINFAGRKNGEIRYFLSDSHYGYGVGSCKLVPFHTVAVDPTVVALGSVVYIRETDGMLLPSGEIHDGIWRAEDVGGAIKRDRIDLFVGDGARGDVLEAVGIHNLDALTVSIVERPKPGSCVESVRE